MSIPSIPQLVLVAGLTLACVLTLCPDAHAQNRRQRREHPPIVPAAPMYTDQRTPAAELTSAREAQAKRGELVTWSFDVSGTYDNPFDARQVRLDAEVTMPDGETVLVPGFFAKGFERNGHDAEGEEVLTPTDEGGWSVRFRPWQAGQHTVAFTLGNQGQTLDAGRATLDVDDVETRGMIRVSPHNPRTFMFDNGDSYVPVGINMAWPGPPGTHNYDRWLGDAAPHGVNWVRVWIAPHFNRLALERPTLGVGQIDQTSAWKIEYLLNLAEQNGIYLMLCFDAHGGLSTRVNPAWHDNAYNAKNGGPCEKPTDYWTNPEALAQQRNRYRYAVARFGHSPAVFAWEFFNEMQFTDEDELYIGTIRDWHERMGRYLKSIDPYQHLVTTSGAPDYREDLLEVIPDLDFVQTHTYSIDNAADAMRRIAAERAEATTKPHLFGEIGINPGHGFAEKDEDGVHLHNLIWAGLFTQTPASGMTWWWDSYLDPLDLWWQYGPASRFMDGVPVADGPIRELTVENLRRATPIDELSPRLLRISGSHAYWQPHASNLPRRVEVAAGGAVTNAQDLSGLLHGEINHPTLRNPVTIAAQYETPGTFAVEVTEVSAHGGASLRITVDGKVALDKTFPDPNGEEQGGTTRDYNGHYTIDLPAGPHEITVENPGADWMRARYELLGPVTDETPWLDIHAVTLDAAEVGEPAALVWFRNQDSVFDRAIAGIPVEPVPAAKLDLIGVPDGDYELQWWDTYKGEITDTASVSVRDGRLNVEVPEVERDVALRLIRQTPVGSGAADLTP